MPIIIESIGYLGTLLVIISMMMSSINKLRLINICGSILSATYACFTNTIPIVVLNCCLIIINLYHLINQNKKYKISFIKTTNKDRLLNDFIKHNINKINKIYNLINIDSNNIYLIYYNMEIIGYISGKLENDILIIDNFYITNKYYDYFKLTNNYDDLKTLGINNLLLNYNNHKYFNKLGFVNRNNQLVKNI